VTGARLLLPGGSADGAQCARPHWVGAWSASPNDALHQNLQNQTVRMVLRPHIGGSRVRLRFTNRFGTEPMTVSDVRIAKRRSNASIVAGSDHRVFWGGRGKVTIPPGDEMLSDPVRIRFGAFGPLAISAFVPGSAPATRHYDAEQTSYLTPAGTGDHSGDSEGHAFVPVTSWLLVDGPETSTRQPTGAVVAFGDSLTDGFHSGIDADSRYPDYLQRRLLRDDGTSRLSVLNAGITANELLQFTYTPIGSPSGLSRARADAIDQPGATDAIILEGVNDLGFSTADEVIAGLKTLIHRFRAHELHVLLGTLLPRGATGEIEQRRRAVNRWILGRDPSLTVDFARVVRDPTHQSRLAARYDSGDHLHPNAAGYKAMAAAVPLSRLRGATCR
jgi:lysophospholipase L1-like esterase